MESRFTSYLPKAKKEIVLLYLVVAALWIVLLDRLVVAFIPLSFETFRWWDLVKDLLFVGLSGITLSIFANRVFDRLEQVEERLERREKEYRQLFQMSPVAIWVIDAVNLNIRAANESAFEQLEYTREDLTGLAITDVLIDQNRETFTALIREGRDRPTSCLLKTKSGAIRSVELNIQSTTFEESPAWIVTIHDTTRRREAEKALIASESLFRSLVDSMEEVVFTLDKNQKLLGVFGRGADRYEIKSRVGNGKTSLEVFGPEQGAVHVEANEKALHGESVLYEWSIPYQGAIRFYQTSLSPIYDDKQNITGIVGISRDITAFKKIQIDLAESELKFRNLVEGSTVGIYIFDGKRLVYVNPALATTFGYSLEQFLSIDSITDLIVEDDRPLLILQPDDSVNGSAVAVNTHVRGIHADNSIIDLEINGIQTIYLGAPAVIGTVVDITEHKNLERALIKSEMRYRSLVEQASDCIILLDGDKQIVQVNARMTEVSEYQADDLIGRTITDFLVGGNDNGLEQTWPALVSGQIIRFECELIKKNQNRLFVESSARTVGEGLVQVIIRDVSERKRAEIALINSEQRYRSLIEQATDGILVNTIGGPFTVVNTKASEMLGYTREEFLSMYPDVFLPPLPHETIPFVREELQVNAVIRLEREITRKDGSHFEAEIDLGLIEGDQVQAIIRDVTQRKLAEKELHRTNRALRALSATNRALVHAADETNLLKETCRVLVEEAGYGLAWVGCAINDVHKSVVPMACSGDRGGYLERTTINWAEYPFQREPTGMAIRTGIPTAVRFSDPNLAREPWNVEAFSLGFVVAAALPLIIDGSTFGALTIFHFDGDAFDETELAFLAELADDIAFGMASFRLRERQMEAESALMEQESRHTALLQAIPDTILRVGIDGIILDAKTPADNPLRFATPDLTGNHLKDVFNSFMGEILVGYCHQTLAKRTPFRWDCVSSDQKNQIAYEFRFEISGMDEVLIIIRDSSQQWRLERRIMEISALEQRRIGQDIHDGLGQQLTGLSYIGRSLARLLELEGSPHAAIALQLQQESERAVTQARNLAHGLNPVELTRDGLYQALREMATHVQEVYRIKCIVSRSRNFKINNATTAYHLYRIAQEAINNAIKHGVPSQITVRLIRDVDHLVLDITDNGAGIKPGGKNKGMGMHTMNYRASMIGAVFQVNSQAGKGTTVSCTLPVTSTSLVHN